MTTAIDRTGFAVPTFEDHKKTMAEMRGDSLRLPKAGEGSLRVRFGPAFTVRNGVPIFHSAGRRHYSVPGANTESGKYTFDCPAYAGEGRCIVCENEMLFREKGMWEGRNGVAGSLHFRFNVIDPSNPEKGFQILEDTQTLYKMVGNLLKRYPMLMDPFEGYNVDVERLDDKPWREVFADVEGGKISLDELHPDALEWAKMGVLENLDESWNYPTYEEQLAIFGQNLSPKGALPEAGASGQVVETTATVVKSEPSQDRSSILDALNKAKEQDGDS